MAENMPWIIMVVVVFGSLGVLVAAIVILSRTVFELSAKIGELSTRKPFYLCEVEKGAAGITRVIPIDPDSARAGQQEMGDIDEPPPAPDDVPDYENPGEDPSEVHLDSRE